MKPLKSLIYLLIAFVISTNVKAQKKETADQIPAVKLMNGPDGSCTFVKGFIPSLKHMNTSTFWISDKTEAWEQNAHPAPRRQYVITIAGKIKFKVSNGSTFVIEPGTVLLAEDMKGSGHTWSMLSKRWERLYIPITNDAEDLFVPAS